VPTETITIRTDDGDCPAFAIRPDGAGPWPGVILFMDAGGIRPALIGMAERLARAGYLVLLPDMFYRYGPFVPREVFAGDVRAILGPLVATTGNDKAAADCKAFLAWFDTQPDVAGPLLGAVGFCMGGGMALAAAGTWPDRFAAVASYHGGNLATDLPTSPHLLAPHLKAEVYIAAATDDASYPPAMADRLETALTDAGVVFATETYPAAHGWMKPDFPVYDAAEAERGWAALLALFGRTLARA
jgi:carboxymethylenebutenolidase